jgi:ABC-2 type transport system permease protein
MNRSVFWALVRKDIYLLRGFISAALGTGLLAVGLVFTGKIGFAIGGILFLTANVAGAIFIAMYTLFTERKDQSRLFALSLPISGTNYDRAKLVGGYVGYCIPWTVLTLLAIAVFLLAPDADRGMVVYAIVLQGFVLALFSIVMAALFVITSEIVSGLSILCVNILFSLFMVTVNQPSVTQPWKGPDIVWTPFAVAMVTGEAIVITIAVCFCLFVTARKRDHL